jgi:hypothetical protein
VFRTITLIALFLFCASSLPADDKLLVPEDVSPIQLCPDCTTITVLVKPGKSQISLNDQPQIAGLFLSGVKKDTQKFKVKWVGAKHAQALEITLDPVSVGRSGTYDLYIDLQPQTNSAAERFHLQILHPEPKLNAVPKLLIDRTCYFFRVQSDSQPRLTLVESSNLSNLTKVHFTQDTNTALGAKLIGGTVRITEPEKQIDAGKSANFAYEVVDDFPIGTATGTLTVRAAETTGPAGTVDFEVRSHLHPIYIGVTIFIGLVVSFLLKVYFQQKIELDQVKLDARKLLERVVDLEGKHHDAEFLKAYKDAKDALESVLGGDSAVDVNARKTDLDTVWRDALQKLATRHQELETKLTKFSDTVGVPWFVPKTIREALEKTKSDLALAQVSLDRDDLRDVKQLLEDSLPRLGDTIRTNALAWQSGVNGILDELLKSPQGISKAIGDKLAKPVDDVRATLNKISPATDLSTIEQVHQALIDLRTERTTAAQFFDWLRVAVSAEVSGVQTAAKQLGPSKWDMVTFDKLLLAEKNLEDTLSVAADSPSWGNLETRLSEFHNAWIQALQSQLKTPPAGVDDLLKGRDYKGAAEAVITQLKKNHSMLGSAAPVATLPIQVPGFTQAFTIASTSPVYLIRSHFQTLFTAAPVMPTSVTAARQLWRDKFWQSLVVGLIVTVFGYTTQLGTFVGTFTELSTLFFWAFGLDLTVDTVKTLAAKKAS